jgi:hypothetical protein
LVTENGGSFTNKNGQPTVLTATNQKIVQPPKRLLFALLRYFRFESAEVVVCVDNQPLSSPEEVLDVFRIGNGKIRRRSRDLKGVFGSSL